MASKEILQNPKDILGKQCWGPDPPWYLHKTPHSYIRYCNSAKIHGSM